jgi:hypothetical protein
MTNSIEYSGEFLIHLYATALARQQVEALRRIPGLQISILGKGGEGFVLWNLYVEGTCWCSLNIDVKRTRL